MIIMSVGFFEPYAFEWHHGDNPHWKPLWLQGNASQMTL